MKFLIFSLLLLLSSGSHVQSRIMQVEELMIDDVSIERQQIYNEHSNKIEEINSIELVFAIDKGFYESADNDMRRVLDYCNKIIINANHIFKPLNVRLVPIQTVEIWEDANQNDDVLTYIKNFALHSSQNLLKKYKFDASILLTHQKFKSGVISVSMGNEICNSNNTSTAVISTNDVTSGKVTLAMVHEIGHMLGMGHDNSIFSNCECEEKTCIMNVFNEEPYTKWSSCSKRHMLELIKSGKNHCLH